MRQIHPGGGQKKSGHFRDRSWNGFQIRMDLKVSLEAHAEHGAGAELVVSRLPSGVFAFAEANGKSDERRELGVLGEAPVKGSLRGPRSEVCAFKEPADVRADVEGQAGIELPAAAEGDFGVSVVA